MVVWCDLKPRLSSTICSGVFRILLAIFPPSFDLFGVLVYVGAAACFFPSNITLLLLAAVPEFG
jgi:hypothetical protein